MMELADLVSRYLPLTANGGECKARCPFHADTGESLRVGATWRCLSCGAHEEQGSDAIGWLMSWDGCDRETAVEQLSNGSLPDPKPILVQPLKRPPFWGIKALAEKPSVKVWIHDTAEGVTAGRLYAKDRVHLGLCHGRSFDDLSCVSGRDCILFPANDRDSLQTMQTLAELLYATGHKTVRWVDAGELGEGRYWPGELQAEEALAYARKHAKPYPSPKGVENADSSAGNAPPIDERPSLKGNGSTPPPGAETPASRANSYVEEARRSILAGIVYRRTSDIAMWATEWLWPDKIPLGEICVIQGDPGLGKSQICASLCAIITKGGQWPVTRERAAKGSVIILSAEDNASKTITPRLKAAGADLDKCWQIQAFRDEGRQGPGGVRGFSLATDISALAVLIQELGDTRLVIIDPVSAYLDVPHSAKTVDSHKNQDVRGLLRPLNELVERENITVILINHLTKSAGRAITRGQGNIAFVAAPRAAWQVSRDKDDPSKRLFLCLKNNLGADDAQTGLSFGIEPVDLGNDPAGRAIRTSRILWNDETVAMSADEAASNDSLSYEEHSTLNDAKEFLESILRHGRIKAKEVLEAGRLAGHSSTTLGRAKRALRIKSTREEFGGTSYWELNERNDSQSSATPD
jgi:putative DNA primase/helicase